jgi:hypothetical protein
MKTKVFEPGAICAAARFTHRTRMIQCAPVPKAWMRDVIFRRTMSM